MIKRSQSRKSIVQRSFAAFLVLLFSLSLTSSLASALTPEQQTIYNEGINYYDICGGSSGASTPSTPTSPTVDSSSTPANGQSLGGVAGTGFTQDDINKAKA